MSYKKFLNKLKKDIITFGNGGTIPPTIPPTGQPSTFNGKGVYFEDRNTDIVEIYDRGFRGRSKTDKYKT